MFRYVYHMAFIVLALTLAACGGDNDEQPALPTLITVIPQNDTAPEPIAEATAELTADAVVAGNRTPLPETWTPEPTTTGEPTITVTPSSTITSTPSWTPTATASATLEPNAINDLAQLMLQFTPLPTEFVVIPGGGVTPTITPTPTLLIVGFPTSPAGTPVPGIVTPTGQPCQYPAPGEFGTVLTTYPNIAAQIGCPVGQPPAPSTATSAAQPFENGAMLWVDGVPGTVYVLYDDGSYQTFPDTYDPNLDPESGGEQPPPDRFAPIRGFGKVWREQPGVRDRLGWATGSETGGSATIQAFLSGRMLAAAPRGDMLTLIFTTDSTSGTWQSLPRAAQ